jgi:hypothetical protein
MNDIGEDGVFTTFPNIVIFSVVGKLVAGFQLIMRR